MSCFRMSSDRPARDADWRSATIRSAGLVLTLLAAGGLAAQETVAITVPASTSFTVINVSTDTIASTNPALIRFEQAALTSGRSLKISVRAVAANLSPPSGPSIPSANLSWTAAGATGGSGFNGVVNSSSFTTVFQSAPNPTSGGVDLNWKLSSPGVPLRAGVHSVSLEWKLESIP